MTEHPAALALAALGDSSADIATRLEALGIKGQPVHSSSCPVFRYLQQKGLDPVSVTMRATLLGDGTVLLHTSALRVFVRMFDGGCFPALDASRRQS